MPVTLRWLYIVFPNSPYSPARLAKLAFPSGGFLLFGHYATLDEDNIRGISVHRICIRRCTRLNVRSNAVTEHLCWRHDRLQPLHFCRSGTRYQPGSQRVDAPDDQRYSSGGLPVTGGVSHANCRPSWKCIIASSGSDRSWTRMRHPGCAGEGRRGLSGHGPS
jgi:hypothetical protein